MKIDELNTTVRTLIQQIIDNGYKKKPICDVTLGSSFNPQFNSFLNGDNLGLAPLTRLMEGLGYELHIVPIKKDESDQVLQENYNTFITTSNQELTEYLDSRPVSPRGNTANGGEVTNALNNVVDDIVSSLG